MEQTVNASKCPVSYLVGRALGWGYVVSGVYHTIGVSKQYSKLFQQTFNKYVRLKKSGVNYDEYYFGKINTLQKYDRTVIKLGIVHGALDRYVYSKKVVYPLLNESRQDLVHLKKLHSEQQYTISKLLKGYVKFMQDLSGNNITIVILDKDEKLKIFNNKLTRKLIIDANKKRFQTTRR